MPGSVADGIMRCLQSNRTRDLIAGIASWLFASLEQPVAIAYVYFQPAA
jgi:hypothetical protein